MKDGWVNIMSEGCRACLYILRLRQASQSAVGHMSPQYFIWSNEDHTVLCNQSIRWTPVFSLDTRGAERAPRASSVRQSPNSPPSLQLATRLRHRTPTLHTRLANANRDNDFACGRWSLHCMACHGPPLVSYHLYRVYAPTLPPRCCCCCCCAASPNQRRSCTRLTRRMWECNNDTRSRMHIAKTSVTSH